MQQESQTYPSAATVAPSGSNGGSLFNPDEVRFMDDSLSNADSFDPFTIGAPGFKVPNVLPANLGGIGSIPREGDSIGSASRTWSDREQHGQNGSSSSSTSYPQQQTQYTRQTQSPLTSNSRGGYGRDKAWQMQQLEALQAESERYRASKTQMQLPEGNTSPSMPDFSHTIRPGSSLNAMDGNSPWLQQEQLQQPHSTQQYPNGAFAQLGQPETVASSSSTYANQTPASSSNDLSHLALRFPSSHHFPAAQGSDEASSKRQRRSKGEEAAGVPIEGESVPRRGRSPNARPPWSQPPDLSKMQPGSMPLLSNNLQGQVVTASQDTNPASAQQQRGSLNIDIDAPYTYLPAPKPPPKMVDLGKAAGKNIAIPPKLSDAFFSPNLARYQPHLLLLRQEQMKRKERGLSANIRKGDKKVTAKQEDGSPDGNDGDGDKKKASHTLLTEAEKKANHIASEQKRRANIRKGYEMLCDLVPALREDCDGGDRDEEGMEEDGDGEEDDVKRGKRRRGYETSGGGDRIEGRTGPRSEAAILMAAVEHLRGQLEAHRDLVIQKQDAQLRVAQRFGLDIRADASTSTSSAAANK